MATIRPMGGPVKRQYRSQVRAEAAARTRSDIIAAARSGFAAHGYAGTTMTSIADAADVNVDTIYAAVGTKPDLLRLVLETAISGTDDAVPALERDYVRRLRSAPSARQKLQAYASALAEILPRLAPIEAVLDEAARQVPALADLADELHGRRAENMGSLADELLATGEIRPGLSRDEIADVVWVTNSATFYRLVMSRPGWTPNRFGEWLADAWARLLLSDPAP